VSQNFALGRRRLRRVRRAEFVEQPRNSVQGYDSKSRRATLHTEGVIRTDRRPSAITLSGRSKITQSKVRTRDGGSFDRLKTRLKPPRNSRKTQCFQIAGASSGDVRSAERDAVPLRARLNVSRALGEPRDPALRPLRAVREELAGRHAAQAARTQARPGVSGKVSIPSRQNAAMERSEASAFRNGAPTHLAWRKDKERLSALHPLVHSRGNRRCLGRSRAARRNSAGLVVPGERQRVRAKRGPMTGSAPNRDRAQQISGRSRPSPPTRLGRDDEETEMPGRARR
jgi:hypothetical protein